MPNIGPLEIAILLFIALLVLGPKRLPEAGRSAGRGLREFKNAISSIGVDNDDEDDAPPALPPASPQVVGAPAQASADAVQTPVTRA